MWSFGGACSGGVRGLFPGDLIAGYSTVVSWLGGSMGGCMN